jgi:phosphohistidine phosphatase
MKLYLLRHALAVDADSFRGGDADRPLSDEGFDVARQVAESMPAHVPHIDKILCSPFIRARQTADEISRSYPDVQVESLEALILGANIGKLRDAINALARDDQLSSVLLIGHQPELDELSGVLCGHSVPPVKFKPATLCCFEMSRSGKASFEWMRRAEEI